MQHLVWILLAVIAIVFLLMLPMHMRTGRFHWVPPKLPGESKLEQVHRHLHEGFENNVLSAQAPVGEGFEGAPLASESPVLEFAPDTPAPVEREDQPYTLLGDWFPAAKASKPLGAAACYRGDYERQHDCVGNYKQETNNYRRNFPDSCSGAPQDFTMQFYGRA